MNYEQLARLFSEFVDHYNNCKYAPLGKTSLFELFVVAHGMHHSVESVLRRKLGL